MLKTLVTGTAVSLMLAGAAIAQDAGGQSPGDFGVEDRAVFVNEEGSMRTEAEIRANWDALTPERQDAMRVKCEEQVAKNERNDGDTSTIPTPGNDFDANVACGYVMGM